MNINKEWHLKNKMPKNPTFEERVRWLKSIIKVVLADQVFQKNF